MKRFLSCALWLICITGCSSYRTVTVRVVDAETGELIPNATLQTYRHEGWPFWEQQEVKTYAAPNGVARVRAIKDPLGAVSIVPRAAGYLPYWAGDADADGKPIPDWRMTELPPWPFRRVTLTLYSKPEPKLVLIVPDNYRGLVQLSMPVGCRPAVNGVRRFEFVLVPGTRVRVPALPQGPQLPIDQVRYASGTPVPRAARAAPETVTLRHGWGGHVPLPDVRKGKGNNIQLIKLRKPELYIEVYVIGTEADQRRARALSDAVHLLGGPPPPNVTTMPGAP